MNETLSTIYSRRAVRKYQNKPVDKSSIEKIIEAGTMAPSAINGQPWKFYVLTDKGLIKKISAEICAIAEEHFHLAGKLNLPLTEDFIFHGAPVVIFLTAPKTNEWAAIDIGACAQNMMLAAKSMGLDSCPVGLAKFVTQTSSYPMLKIPAGELVILAVILGYGDETPEVHERLKNNVIYVV